MTIRLILLIVKSVTKNLLQKLKYKKLILFNKQENVVYFNILI